MALVTTKEMFKKAYAGGYAIGAFNINNMEIIQAITEAAAEAFYENAPEGATLSNMTFDDVIITVTVDEDGFATDHEIIYLVTADTQVALEDGTQVPLKMVMDYIMTVDVTARGGDVEIEFSDFSAFQEIDPSMLEE